MNIHFYKYQGTGNDFVIVDNRNDEYTGLTTEQIAHLCDRRFGIGADGLMMLENQNGYDFRMKYYNSDGREGSMCGNGGRCLTAFARQMGINKPELKFIAVDGEHEAKLRDNGWVDLKMQNVQEVENGEDFFYLNTGSPHYVKFVTDVQEVDVYEEGRAVRYSDRFKATGTNVNFVQEVDNGIFVRTYERGVEDETFSCGTGVTAAALTAAPEEAGSYTIPVETLGGHLEVRLQRNGAQQYENIWLCGPATLVFEGNITIK